MGAAKENLKKIVLRMEDNVKVEDMFTTNIGGKDIAWDKTFQFTLDNEVPFFLEIKNKKVKIVEGTSSDAGVVLTGDPNSIVNICNGKGDFTHAISREEITVAEGKVMDVIRLTKAITIILKIK
ncbi:MAG: SCP2 sterol-binding domain-containing protein [Candidatus Hodarchaeota archaeon]